MDIVVGTDIRDGNGTTRMVNWCGCIIQDPHPSVRALGFLPEEGHGVYVARYTIIVTAFQGRLQLHNNWYSIIYLFCTKVSSDVMYRWCQGSPVHRYGLYALQWIVEVNGKPTPDLETFIQVAQVH